MNEYNFPDTNQVWQRKNKPEDSGRIDFDGKTSQELKLSDDGKSVVSNGKMYVGHDCKQKFVYSIERRNKDLTFVDKYFMMQVKFGPAESDETG